MTERKIQAMYKYYGKEYVHKCNDCCNLVEKWHDRKYFKCLAYSTSSSEASDWAKSWRACGRFNKPYDAMRETQIVELVKRAKRPKPVVDGQIGLEGCDDGNS